MQKLNNNSDAYGFYCPETNEFYHVPTKEMYMELLQLMSNVPVMVDE